MGTIGSTIECEITKQFGSHYMCILLQHSLVQLRILKIHTLIPKMLLFFAVNRTLLLVLYLHKFYISTIWLNICLIKIRSEHRSNTLLSLLQSFMRQTLEKKITKYWPLCSISHSKILAAVKNGLTKIQAPAYAGVRTVYKFKLEWCGP